MKSFTKWVRKNPIGAFLLWFFPVAWGVALIPSVIGAVVGSEPPFEPFVSAATWLGLLLPAVVITRIVDGSAGVRDLGRRLLRVRVSPGWYALSLLAVPLLAMALAGIVAGRPTAPTSALPAALGNGLIVGSVVGLISTNLWEEVAWMGFVQARLQARRGAMLAAAVTAALFALQHLPIAVGNGPAFVVVLLALFVLAIPFRALAAWLYNRTGSLFLVGVLHAVGDATGSGIGDGLLRRLYANGDVALLSIGAEALLGLAVIAGTRGRLGLPASPARGSQDGAARAEGGLAVEAVAAHATQLSVPLEAASGATAES